MSGKADKGTYVFVSYSNVVHESVVQRMFGRSWKQKLAIGRVLRSEKKSASGGARRTTYVSCKWLVKPQVREKEFAAQSVMLRAKVAKERRLGDIVVHEALVFRQESSFVSSHP